MAVDKKTLKRMQDIDKLDDSTKDKLYFLIDNVVQNSKAKKSFRLLKRYNLAPAGLYRYYLYQLLSTCYAGTGCFSSLHIF